MSVGQASADSTSMFDGNVPASSAFMRGLRKWWPYYVMMAPGILFFVIFHYLPIWEAKIAFEQLRIIPPNIWVGLKHFQTLFASPVFWQVLANTLIINGINYTAEHNRMLAING